MTLTTAQMNALKLVAEGNITWQMGLQNPVRKEGYRQKNYWQPPNQLPYKKLAEMGLIHKDGVSMRLVPVRLTTLGQTYLENNA